VPLYEYECKFCGNRFEKIQKFSDPLVTTCPKCGKEDAVEQMISAPAVQFKGSGWYVTDYAKKGSRHDSSPDPSIKASSSVSGSDSKSSESKSETKSSGSDSDSKSSATKSENKPAANTSKKSSDK
jgi:putative FmdB family regulatory protein